MNLLPNSQCPELVMCTDLFTFCNKPCFRSLPLAIPMQLSFLCHIHHVSLVRSFLFILITAGLLYSLYLLHRGEQKFCISLINSKDIFSSLTLFPLEEGSERKNTCWPNDQHLPLLKTNELACHLKSTYLAIWCHWQVCTL